MNEKLKEIAVRAQVEHCVSHVRLQEFAELIVRECMIITDELVVNSTQTSIELYADYNDALFEVKRRIKEHFGVEE